MPDNPFSPTFGISPPVLAGRQQVLRDFRDALQAGVGSPGRATIYVGGRGCGKTVLLNEVEDVAASLGWISISETASPGLVRRLVESRLPMAARRAIGEKGPSARLTSLRAFGFAVQWEHPEEAEATSNSQSGDLREMLGALADEMEERGNGLLLTVDELQGADRTDLVELATSVQHLFRERKSIAIAFGGLPSIVKDRLLDDPVLTFLRRAERHSLETVATFEASDALQETAEGAGRSFDAEALELASEATAGYPFMIQLIGFHAWKASEGSAVIQCEHVRTAVPEAERRLASLVLEPSLQDLSATDRRFLLAMSLDDGPSKIAQLAERLGFSSNQASQYRLRLLDSGMIDSPSRGLVNISMPYLREFLRKHGALGETLD